jgi:hypothetical protein
MKRTWWAPVALALLTAGTALAADPWLHVRVDGKHDDERVRVNVPLSLVEALLPLLEDSDFAFDGRIRIDDVDVDHEDLANFLKAVRDAQDGVYVTVEDGHDHVRVAKEGKYLHVEVTERRRDPDDAETARIRVPMRVIDALLSGNEGELDVMAGIRALGEEGEGEIVAVSDGDSEVRVWVDQKPESD